MIDSGAAGLPSRSATPALLAKWRDAVQAAVMTIGRTRLELSAKNPAGMNTPEDDALIRVQESLRQVSRGLHDVAPKASATAGRASHDLGTLAALDTPAARDLLAALDAAVIAAERVDAERGNVLPDDIPLSPSETRGTDLAEAVAIIAARVRDDVRGAQGRD